MTAVLGCITPIGNGERVAFNAFSSKHVNVIKTKCYVLKIVIVFVDVHYYTKVLYVTKCRTNHIKTGDWWFLFGFYVGFMLFLWRFFLF